MPSLNSSIDINIIQLIIPPTFVPGPPPPPPDFILGTMNLLRSSWQLTGSLSVNNINFQTGFYQEQVKMPAIIITPLLEPMQLLHIGNKPQYKLNHIIQCHVWVQPPTASNTALGQAKNQRYQLQQEVERIIRSGSTIIPGIQFARISESFGRELMEVNPPILGWEMRFNTIDFRLYPETTLVPPPTPPPPPAVFNPVVFNVPIFKTVVG